MSTLLKRSGSLVALALALAACKPAPAPSGAIPPDAVLKVGSQRGSTKALLLASHVLDGAPYRVEWSEFPAAQNLLEALSAGAVDVGEVGDAPFLFAYAAGSKIHVAHIYKVDHPGNSAVSIIVPKDSPLHAAADLKGRRIATGRGSIGHYLLLRALQAANIRPDQVTIVFLDPGQAKAALASGSVDAWSTWVPYTAIAVQQDGERILAGGVGLVNSVGFEAATDSAIADKHAVVFDFMKRLSRAQLWANAHKSEFAHILSKETGLPADIALQTVAARGDYAPAPADEALIQQEENALETYKAAGAVTASRPVADAFDHSFDAAATP
jgi:sulfonate transport system substrate-binding protein